MQDQSLLPDSIDSQKRYKLLQNFSLISLSAFVLATVILSAFYRQQALHDLKVLQEENNVALTKLFSKTLWKKYGVFLTSTQTLNDQQLAEDIRISRLREDIIAQIEGLSVTKIKIFDLQGRTVFSTDLSQIGEDKSQSSGFLSAKSGQVITQLEHRDSFKALETNVKNIHLLYFQRDFIELLLDKVFSALACDQVVITVVFCREHIFFVFCNSLCHFCSICFLFGQSLYHIIV